MALGVRDVRVEKAAFVLLGGLMRVNVHGRRFYISKQQRQVRQQTCEEAQQTPSS